MTLKFFLRIRIDSNQIESNPVFLSSNRIESNHFKIRFDSIHSEPYCWYLNMLKREIYIIIYQKILKKLLGNIKFVHFIIFHKGKFIYLYLYFLFFLINI